MGDRISKKEYLQWRFLPRLLVEIFLHEVLLLEQSHSSQERYNYLMLHNFLHRLILVKRGV